MNILHLIYDHINNPWVGGGGAVRAHEIYRRIAGRHQVTLVCGKYPGAADYREDSLDFRFMGTGSNNYFLSTFCYAARAARFLNKEAGSADVIVEDFAPWNPVFSFMYKKRKAVILQIQSHLGAEILKKYLLPGIPFYLVEKFYPERFENFIFVSPAVSRKNSSHSTVISNGIDESLLTLEIRGENYIGYLGRLDIHTKGLDTLVKASSSLGVPLRIAGEGKDRVAFLATIKKSNNIQWVGAVKGESKNAFLEGMEFLVLPSRFEGQGIVLLEAAASGKPVIVSDIPGLRYAVDAGFGITFKTGDAGDLAQKIKFLLENNQLRKEMGQKAREYAKNFTWDKIALDYERYLLKITDRQ